MRRIALWGLAAILLAAYLPQFAKIVVAQEQKAGKASQDETSSAKEAKAPVVYRVEYSVRELENAKRLNARSYTLLVGENVWAKIRVGNDVPLMASTKISEGSGTATIPISAVQYRHVGISIDCKVSPLHDDEVVVSTHFESSSLVPSDEAGGVKPYSNPVFRQVQSEVDSRVSLARPTVISTMDDVSTNRRYEIEVVATKPR